MNRLELGLTVIVLGTLFAVAGTECGPPPEGWTPPGKGWVCLGDVCKRRIDARAIIGRPQTVERDRAWVTTDDPKHHQEIDYAAAPTREACEAVRFHYQTPCEELP